MQYWASDVAGLADTLPPLFEFIKRIAHTGHNTAMSMYGVKKGTLQMVSPVMLALKLIVFNQV